MAVITSLRHGDIRQWMMKVNNIVIGWRRCIATFSSLLVHVGCRRYMAVGHCRRDGHRWLSRRWRRLR